MGETRPCDVWASYTPATFDTELLFGASLGNERCQSLSGLAQI